MNKHLHPLDQARRPFTACLHFSQIVKRNRTTSQFLREQIRSRNGVLNGEIDTNATCRRHRVRRVADTKQSFAAPVTQTIDLYPEQLDLRPVIQLGHAIAQKSGETDNLVLKLRQPAPFDLVESPFRNDEAALPVIAAIEQHKKFAVLEKTERLFRILGLLGDPHPEDVDRRAKLTQSKTDASLNDRVPPVRADDKVRTNFQLAAGSI